MTNLVCFDGQYLQVWQVVNGCKMAAMLKLVGEALANHWKLTNYILLP